MKHLAKKTSACSGNEKQVSGNGAAGSLEVKRVGPVTERSLVRIISVIPVRWMDYPGKGEMLTNRDVNKFVNNKLREISLCVWNISGIFYFSS